MRLSPFADAANETDLLSDRRVRPLWTIGDLDDTEKILKWSNETYAAELKRILPYREQALKHVALFKGKFGDVGNVAGTSAQASMNGLGPVTPSRPNKLVVNHLYDLTQQRVSRAMRTKPAVQILPANAEYGDRVSAKIVKYWVDYLMYQNNFDNIVARVCRAAFIMGEAYIWVRWNPTGGELHPDWREETAAAKHESRPPRIIKRNPTTGSPVVGEDGEPLYIEKPLYTGDVEFRVVTPLNTIVQYTGDYDCADYFFYEEYKDADELRVLYPEVVDKITDENEQESDDSVQRWRIMAGVKNGPQAGKVLVRYFYHRPTEFLGSGRWIVSTAAAVLENKPLPEGQDGLSLIRLTDIDVPDEQRGLSFYTQGKALNATINDLTSMQRRNMMLLAHPKWTVPRGSVIKKDSLGNDITVVEYQGQVEPKIQVPPPMNQEAMVMKQDLKQDLQLILGTFDVSRGQIPANVRSAAALQALYEQEDMRASAQNVKQATLIRDTIKAAINLASAYYEPSDRRLLPVVGRDNRYLLKEFDPSHLTKAFDIRVLNDTGLPSSSSVRFEWVMRMREVMPNFMTEERAAEFIRFGDEDRHLDAATVASRAAEAENESMLSLETVDEPQPFEDHVIHWMTHMREVQNRGFKTATPPEVQDRFIAHLMATELLMLDAARKNPRYAVELTKIPQFPVFYALSPEDRMILDHARTGNPLSLEQVAMLEESGVMGMMATGGLPPPAGGFNAQTNNTISQKPGERKSMLQPQQDEEEAAPQAAAPTSEQQSST